MNYSELFGILSSVVLIVGMVPYLRDVIRGDVKPHAMSWLGWSLITALGGLAMVSDGAGWVVAMLFANSITCFSIPITALIKRTAVWSVTKADSVLFILGGIGIILWQTLDLPVLALVCAIFADMSFGIPTIIKTYRDPSSETPTAWIFSVVAEIFALLAITQLTFSEIAYPTYLLIYDGLMVLIVIGIIRRRK